MVYPSAQTEIKTQTFILAHIRACTDTTPDEAVPLTKALFTFKYLLLFAHRYCIILVVAVRERGVCAYCSVRIRHHGANVHFTYRSTYTAVRPYSSYMYLESSQYPTSVHVYTSMPCRALYARKNKKIESMTEPA